MEYGLEPQHLLRKERGTVEKFPSEVDFDLAILKTLMSPDMSYSDVKLNAAHFRRFQTMSKAA